MPEFLDNLLAPIRRSKARPTTTLGVGGTSVYGGYIQTNELNSKLTGSDRYKTYSDLLANVSIVASGTRYFLGLIAKAGWKVEPADESAEAEKAAELVDDAIHKMSSPWPRVVRRSALYRFYGFSIQEWTAKMLEDGTVGLKDVEARPQSTIQQWDLDTGGTVQGVIQRSPQSQEDIYLPRSKLVYVVDDSLSDSPEGLGLLRHVVDSATRLRRYEQLEGFGYETDLRGIPVGRGPFALLRQLVAQGQMTQAQADAAIQPLKEFVQGHVKNPSLGMLLDSITYQSLDEAASPSGVKQWDMELLKGDGAPVEAVASAIERLNREIARVLGVENLLLGEKGAGSLALSRDKSNNFGVLVDGTLDELAAVYQMDLVRPLLRLNGIDDPALEPKLKPDRVQYRDVEQITTALSQLAQAGAVLPPDDPAINEVRDMLGVSKQDEQMAEKLAEMAITPKAPPVMPGATAKQPPPTKKRK